MLGRWILDQFVITRRLGEGGMGAVYLAEQRAVGRHAVIKILHPWLSKDPLRVARFSTEARAVARLQNPHIVSIYNYGQMSDGTLFLAMEYLAGNTLADLMRAEGRLEPARAVGIATQCCEALSEAHRRGVIHRDLKPSNIMLVSRGGPDFVKLLDFGIAKLEDADATQGSPIGTPRSMAPEQLQGRMVDARTDIYALGLILYEMLSGQPPFVAETPAAWMHGHLHEIPRSLRDVAPDLRIPPALDACVMRALAKSPYHRQQSADQFAEELWSALMATVDASHLPMPQVRRAPRSGGLLLGTLLGASLGVVVAGIGGWIAWSHLQAREDSAEPSQAATPRAPPAPEQAREPHREPATGQRPPELAASSPPSPEKQSLMSKSIPELEAELQRVTIISALPRDSIELSLEAYRDAIANPPPGTDPNWYRKALLADLIIAWRAKRAAKAPDDRSLDELEAVFLTMESNFDAETRRQMLHQLKNSAAGNPDASWTVELVLLEWIATYGSDSVDDEPQIEILDE